MISPDKPLLTVAIIAGSVAVVSQVLQQLVLTALIQVGQGLNGSFYGQLSSFKQAFLLLSEPVLLISGSLSGQRQFLL